MSKPPCVIPAGKHASINARSNNPEAPTCSSGLPKSEGIRVRPTDWRLPTRLAASAPWGLGIGGIAQCQNTFSRLQHPRAKKHVASKRPKRSEASYTSNSEASQGSRRHNVVQRENTIVRSALSSKPSRGLRCQACQKARKTHKSPEAPTNDGPTKGKRINCEN